MPNKIKSDKTTSNKVKSLISSGSNLAGSAVGGALGFFASGPAGAAAGAAGGAVIGSVLEKVGQEISDRLLAPRQKARVGGVLAMAVDDVKNRLANGESIRDDGFFSTNPENRSEGEEVIEAILIKSQSEPEEKKLKYISKLLSNIAFDSSIDANLAHMLIKQAEALTYRQFCILSLIGQHYQYERQESSFDNQENFPRELYAISSEIRDLYQRELIACNEMIPPGSTCENPAFMDIKYLGEDLYFLINLHRIPDKDLGPIAKSIGRCVYKK